MGDVKRHRDLNKLHTRTLQSKKLFLSKKKQRQNKQRCVTTRMNLLRWLWTMDQECARPDSPVMTLPAPSSLPSSAARVTSASWSAWDRRTPTSVTRPSPREVSSL